MSGFSHTSALAGGEHDSIVVSTLSIATAMLGVGGGAFSLVVLFSKRFHKGFPLLLVHACALLVSAVSQLVLWPVLVSTVGSSPATRQQVCVSFRFLETASRVIANNASSAMAFWYMLLSKIMSGRSDSTLKMIKREMLIYFGGCTLFGSVFIAVAFINISYTLVGTTYCSVLFSGSTDMIVLYMLVFYMPTYAPLMLGGILFMVARFRFAKISRRDSNTAGYIRDLHRLFYWLNWSFLVSQLPIFVIDLIPRNSNFFSELSTVVKHFASLQNVFNAAAIYVIILRRVDTRKMRREATVTEPSFTDYTFGDTDPENNTSWGSQQDIEWSKSVTSDEAKVNATELTNSSYRPRSNVLTEKLLKSALDNYDDLYGSS